MVTEMTKVKIIKKKDDYTMEYEVGDICKVTGTWYGGVHIEGKTGIPVSIDKDEYIELDEPERPTISEAQNVCAGERHGNFGMNHGNYEPSAADENEPDIPERDIQVGDIVRHFKREWVSEESAEYLYKVLAFAQHTENGEKLVIYEALYPPYKTCARPYGMFMSEVDREKYPDVQQKYRFEKVETKRGV